MLFFSAIVAGAALLGSVAAAPTLNFAAGFNLGANRAYDNQCKSTANWQADFQKIIGWGNQNPNIPKAKFRAVKIFSTGDCNALLNAVPAAVNTGVKIWVGVWNVPDWKFNQDKAALEQAIKSYGSGWIAGVNVGSESLYRNEVQPWKLTQQIYDVKGMVQSALGARNVPVGTADTWTSWVRGDVKDVIKACDVVVMNAFPYWQGVPIAAGVETLRQAIRDTGRAMGWSKPIVIGETGWPSGGGNFGASQATLENLRRYWKDTMCWLITANYSYFWFEGFDEPNKGTAVERNFGVCWWGGTAKVNFNLQALCAA